MCKGEYILTDIGTDFILNMPRVDGEYLALALSTKESGPTRATVQGLRKYELDSILRRVEPYALKRTKPHFVLITEVIRILLESDAPKIDGITQAISRFDEDLKKMDGPKNRLGCLDGQGENRLGCFKSTCLN